MATVIFNFTSFFSNFISSYLLDENTLNIWRFGFLFQVASSTQIYAVLTHDTRSTFMCATRRATVIFNCCSSATVRWCFGVLVWHPYLNHSLLVDTHTPMHRHCDCDNTFRFVAFVLIDRWQNLALWANRLNELMVITRVSVDVHSYASNVSSSSCGGLTKSDQMHLHICNAKSMVKSVVGQYQTIALLCVRSRASIDLDRVTPVTLNYSISFFLPEVLICYFVSSCSFCVPIIRIIFR